MSGKNEKFKWLKPFLQLFVFSLLTSTVYADNSTDYSDDDELSDLETFVLIQPPPLNIPQCGMNELYQSCEVDCIDCEKRGLCEPQNCHIAHCDCRMYFVHLTPGGPCEHVSLCPARECPENEVYRHCGPFCESCDAPPCRKMQCLSRCYCKQGYRRNKETGECVPEKDCPARLECLSNDVVAESGPVSEHCLQTEDEALRVNETMEEKKCYCPSGFKRNVHGWCIEEELCDFVTCGTQTVFQDCPRKCNTTCWNYGDPDCVEDGQCYPSCFCAEGYVLNEFFDCIPLDMCPPGSNPFAPTLPPPTIAPIVEPALEETSEASAASTAESDSAAAASSSSGRESGSAAAASSSSGTESGSAEAASGSSESSSAAESDPGTGSAAAEDSSAAAETSSEGSSAAAAESTAGTESSSGVEEGTEKTKETETKETKSEDTSEAPKKPPKKATRSGKIYKSAARKGKTVAPMDDEDE